MPDGRKSGSHETQEKKNMIKHIATMNMNVNPQSIYYILRRTLLNATSIIEIEEEFI